MIWGLVGLGVLGGNVLVSQHRDRLFNSNNRVVVAVVLVVERLRHMRSDLNPISSICLSVLHLQ